MFHQLREQDINGKWIGNAIGFCHYNKHPGSLNKDIAYQHHCIAKKCRFLEKYSEEAWEKKHTYRNRRNSYGKKV